MVPDVSAGQAEGNWNILIKQADLHIHTSLSLCSLNNPEKIIRKAVSTGLDAIAITDHNTIAGAKEVSRLVKDRVEVIIGSEVATDRGDLIGLFLENEISSSVFEDVAEEIHDQSGFVMLPHPFDPNRSSACFPTAEDAKFLDAIEIQNGRYASDLPMREAEVYAMEHGLTGVGNSDAHYIYEIGTIRNYIEGDDIREALFAGKVKPGGNRCFPIGLPLSKFVYNVRKYF